MKFQEGKFIVKLRNSRASLHDIYMFVKITFRNGVWLMHIDDDPPKAITEDIRDNILHDFHQVVELSADYKPAFRKVRVTIEAETDRGTKHVWSRVNGEALEKLLRVFPGIVDCFWTDGNRREKILRYLARKHHKPIDKN